MIGFQLGREYKLSVAEILAVFQKGKTVYLSKDFLILDNIEKNEVLEKASNLGGTIKIVEISDFDILELAKNYETKFKYGLSVFGEKKNLKEILMNLKKEFKANNISSRFINKDFKNLSSAQIIGEKLIKSNSDFSYIYSEDKIFKAVSIWVQNIYEYSKRDWQKDRDMQTGMLPPKLCQMMINIAGNQILSNHIIYDPFVGLGSVLIESILMGNKEVYGSDLSEIMVNNSINNINGIISSNQIKIDNFEIIKLNSKFIKESEILLNKKIDSIVTEGYLGEVMTKKNISIERINKQKESLLNLYEGFFSSLQKLKYKGNIVICFPFWEMGGKYIYFNEIYNIIKKYSNIENILPKDFQIQTTLMGSLLYKREKQLVGREIFKLKIKD